MLALFLLALQLPHDPRAAAESARLQALADRYAVEESALAVRYSSAALPLAERAWGRDSYVAARTRMLLSLYRAFAGDRAGQLETMASGATAMTAAAGDPAQREEAAVSQLTVAQFATSAGRIDLAERRLADGLALLARPDTAQGVDAGEAYDIAADILARRGQFSGSLGFAERAALTIERAAGADAPALSRPLGNIADALIRLGRTGEAEAPLQRALAIADAADPPSSPVLLLALQKLADFYVRTGRDTLAEPLYRRALTIADGLPKGFRYTLAISASLSRLRLARGDLVGARRYAAQTAARAAERLGDAAPEHGEALVMLGQIDLARGDGAAARIAAERATSIFRTALAPDDARHGDALALIAAIDGAAGQATRSAAGYREALAAMATRPAADPDRIATEIDAAAILVQGSDAGDEGWRLARDAADHLAARFTDLDSVAGRDADLTPRERALFDRSVAVAWERMKALGPAR